MKTRTKRTVGMLSASALVLGMLATMQTANAAPEGIRNTKHNLGTNGGNIVAGKRMGSSGMGDVFTDGTDEICVFCHTPHGANVDVPVPLWNKGSMVQKDYKTFSSGTMQGVAPANMAGHMSLACLSCHDGTQAMDNLINAPGSGGLAATNAGSQMAGTWYNNNLLSSPSQGTDTSSGALASGAGIFMLGTDLSNDHPIGMPYAGGGTWAAGQTAGTVCAGCADPDFNAPSNGLNGFFEVGTTGATAGAKTNMRLYGTTAAQATVECASCHDPHSDAQNTFLRRSNAASGVCLTCHNK